MVGPDARTQKARRQARILELVGQRVVDTQEELAAQLQREGFGVTQATVSRDIRELRLVKVPTGEGRARYALAEAATAPARLSDRLLRLFAECVTGVDHSENMVVLSTLAGTAQGVAEAVDALHLPEVIGTLAGERTVFVVVKPRRAVARFLERVRQLTAGPETGGPGGADR